MKNYLFFSLYVVSFILLFSCNNNEEPDLTKAPDALVYTPNTLTLTQGTAGSSVAPTIQGTAPINYAVASIPIQGGITINGQGVIQVANTVPIGTYNITVTASNTAGSKTFTNIYVVTVIAQVFPASNLAYNPNTLTVVEGTAGSSVTPTVNGTAPFTYQVTSSPVTGFITINNQGVISISNLAVQGTYTLKISVINSAGTVDFANAYTITVNQATSPPTNLVYTPNAISIPQGNTANSATPTVQGTQPISFTITTINPSNSTITINAQGVINIANTSPAGTYQISVKATNSVGNNTFNNIYTITVTAPVTFIADIQPLIASRCAPCHTAGGAQSNYTIYNNAKNNINSILDRINRAEGTSGAMPNGGSQLSQANRALFQKWKDDGLKEQ